MPPTGTCSICQATLPSKGWEGLCPKCLVRISLASPPVEGASTDSFRFERDVNQPSPTLPLAVGSDYELLEEIASGGMGVVFKARQLSLNRVVAVKVLLAGKFARPEFVERFRTEAETAAHLRHPNIVAVYGIGRQEGRHYFSMEFVEGKNLAEVVGEKPVAVQQAVAWLQTISEAIHYAHQRGILHRDLKPSNVLIDAFDQPRITDFGLAKLLSSPSELTVTGQMLGTPNYMPPEQVAAKDGGLGPASDIYSLGALLYYLVTGRPPFAGSTLEETLLQVVDLDPISPRRLNPSVSVDLETVCLKCLEKIPAKRYPDAQALADDLGRVLAGEPIKARPIGAAGRLSRWCQRKPLLAGLAATVVFLVIALVIILLTASVRLAEKEFIVRQNAYVADMHLVQQALETKNFGRALELLERNRPRVGRQDLRGWEWRYFWQLCQGEELCTLGTHSNTVTCLAFSPDPQRLLSASLDGEIRLWDVTHRKLLRRLPGSNRVDALAFAPAGDLAAFGSHKGWIQVVDPLTLTSTHPRIVVHERVLGLKFSADGQRLTFAARNNRHDDRCTLTVWDLATRKVLDCQSVETWLHVAFSADGRLFASGFNNGEIILWDMDRKERRFSMTNHASNISTLAFSPDGRVLASGSYDQTARLWDLETGRQLARLAGHEGAVQSLTFLPDSRRLITTSRDQSVKLWDLSSKAEVDTLQGHWNSVEASALSPDGRFLATGSRDGQVKLWNPASTPPPPTKVAFPSDTMSFALSPAGTVLLRMTVSPSGVGSDAFELWELGRLEKTVSFKHAFPKIASAAVSPTGDLVALSGWGSSISVFNPRHPEGLHELTSGGPVHRLAFSPTGTILAASLDDGSLQLWRIKEKQLFRTLRPNRGYTYALAFSAQDQILAAAYEDGTLEIWDPARGERLGLVKGKLTATSVVIWPNGRTVAAGNQDGTIQIWDVENRKLISTLRGGADSVSSLTLSPDLRRLAAGTRQGNIRIWDMTILEEVAVVGKHRDPAVVAVRFLPDGDTLASVSVDGIYLWAAAKVGVTAR